MSVECGYVVQATTMGVTRCYMNEAITHWLRETNLGITCGNLELARSAARCLAQAGQALLELKECKIRLVESAE